MNISEIKRGSLFLTDDFIQALTYNVPATVSSFALLNLPTWDAVNGMYIDSADLGLPAGTISPNVILPAVLKQYWLNLCAYARQYHAQINYGEDIEDFSEQAFWKCLQRLMPLRTFAELKSYIVAKSGDVLMNCNSADGNMYMEVLLSVNGTIKTQQKSFIGYKPTYIQTALRLPSTVQGQVIGGSAMALYDYQKSYYDLNPANCNIVKFEDDENGHDTFNYNAILIYYKVANTEQVAGIYFPNPFVQNAYGIYTLPVITKEPDVTQGYSINIRYSANTGYSYTAENADLGQAMQVYNAWYRMMSNANLQIQTLTKTVMDQGEQIDRLASLVDNNGLISVLYNKVRYLEQQLKTTFKGAVSTNALLELFTAVKNNAGLLNLTMLMSDMTKTIIGQDITVANPIGAYREGDIIETGTMVTDILTKMFATGVPIVYSHPYGSLSVEGETDVYFVDYHYNDELRFTVNIFRGNAGPFELPTNLVIVDNGLLRTVQVTAQQQTVAYTPGPMVVPLRADLAVEYAEGEPLTPETADDRVFAGILNLSIRVIPHYDVYVGMISLLEDLPNLNYQVITGDNWAMIDSKDLNSVIYNPGEGYQVLAMPADCPCPLENPVLGSYTFNIIIDGVSTAYTAYAIQGQYMQINTANLH